MAKDGKRELNNDAASGKCQVRNLQRLSTGQVPPAQQGRNQSRHRHVITIAGETYSFFAAGARKWVFKSDTVSFDWEWDVTGKYRNVTPESVTTWNKDGVRVSRGDFA